METEVKEEYGLEEKIFYPDLEDYKVEPLDFDSEIPEPDQKLDIFKSDPCDKVRITHLLQACPDGDGRPRTVRFVRFVRLVQGRRTRRKIVPKDGNRTTDDHY